MIELSEDEWRRAFSTWLRNGKVPLLQENDAIECKFNPWHDPEDGRFTFAGSGNYHGRGRSARASRAPGNVSRGNLRIARTPTSEAPSAKQPEGFGKRPKGRGGSEAQPKPAGSLRSDQSNPAAEFAGGVGEGLYGVAKGTVEAAHSALTTNPVTTVRNTGLGIATMIDRAIAAEDTPAHAQISRAADAVANASARDIGRAAGSVVGNTALAVAPGAVVGKVSALRRLRGTMPRPPHEPPQIGWVKENLGRKRQRSDIMMPRQAPSQVRRQR